MSGEKRRLENERLLIEVNSRGAELVRIYDKEKNQEVLWEGTPEVWNRHSPILFPFIGKSYQGQYLYGGKTFEMTPHGFARDHQFSSVTADKAECWYRLEDSAETYQNYPFHFCLESGYRLEGNRICVMWRVRNTDDKELLFMLGGHPAFRTPKGKTIYDYTFEFNQKERLHYQAPNEDGYEEANREGILSLKDGKVPLTKGFFKEVLTYIFDQNQITSAGLLVDGNPYVTIHAPGIPYLGVWTLEETHPFVCLEPWFGRCDKAGFTGELKEKEGILALKSNEIFEANYVIEIH